MGESKIRSQKSISQMQLRRTMAEYPRARPSYGQKKYSQAAPQTLLRLCSEDPETQEQQEQRPWQGRHL